MGAVRNIILAACTAALGGCVTAPTADPDRARLQRLDGVYVSAGTEQWYGAYGRRRFEFEDGRWSLVFDFAFDPDMRQRVFTFRTYGTYDVLARSAVEPRAFEATFYEDAKLVTWHIDDPGLIQRFGMANCGLRAGVETDISLAGCANWRPVAECREDHDLLGIDAVGQLYFGIRPADNDMCSADRRPTSLLPPVRRAT